MTEKEQIVDEIITYPLTYAKLWGFLENNAWHKDKLLFTELVNLKQYLNDIKTFERNKQQLHGNN